MMHYWGTMLRIAIALAPWLLLPTCAGFCTGVSRTPPTVNVGWEFVFIDLWQPLFVVCFIFFVPLLILAAVSIFLDLRRARRALRRTRRVIWPWLLLVPCLALFIVSALAHEEAARVPWRLYHENFEDSVPDRYQPLGLFEGPWRETVSVSYHVFLGSLACFGAWLLARGWVAARFATAKRRPKRIRCQASFDGPCD